MAKQTSPITQFHYSPPTEKLAPLAAQTVEVMQGRTPIARAAWQPIAGVPGACQVLWVEVSEPFRRQGNGALVMEEALRQAKQHARAHRLVFRRALALVAQPNVIARAWLGSRGFMHVNTLEDLAAEGEVVVMVRTFS